MKLWGVLIECYRGGDKAHWRERKALIEINKRKKRALDRIK